MGAQAVVEAGKLPRYNDPGSYPPTIPSRATARSLGYATNGANPPIVTFALDEALKLHDDPASGGIDHNNIPTANQKAGLDNAPTPITGANPVASMADVGGGGGVDPAADYTWTGNHVFQTPITVQDGAGGATGEISVSGAVLHISIPAGSGVTKLAIHKIGGQLDIEVDKGIATYTEPS